MYSESSPEKPRQDMLRWAVDHADVNHLDEDQKNKHRHIGVGSFFRGDQGVGNGSVVMAVRVVAPVTLFFADLR